MNLLQLKEGRKEGRKARTGRRERKTEGRRKRERAREKEQRRRKRERALESIRPETDLRNLSQPTDTQNWDSVIDGGLRKEIQESISRCHLRPLLITVDLGVMTFIKAPGLETHHLTV